MVTVDTRHGTAGQEDYEKNDHDEQPNEGTGTEGEIIEKSTSERVRHRRRLQALRDRQQQLHARRDHAGRVGALHGGSAGPAVHTARAAVHHEPHEEGGRGSRTD